MNSPATAFLLSLNCSEALAVVGPTRGDAVLTAELIGGAKCESLPRGGSECREEEGETVRERVWGLPQSSTPGTAGVTGRVWDFPRPWES